MDDHVLTIADDGILLSNAFEDADLLGAGEGAANLSLLLVCFMIPDTRLLPVCFIVAPATIITNCV
jgi:hypothetical protein